MTPNSRDPLDSGPAASNAAEEFPRIEGYDLIDQIGRGGMGIVYEAYQQSTGRRVAIKFMSAGAAASAEARRRFEREVELVARLEHPGIVSVLDSGIHRGHYYYVMEFVDGRSLDECFTPGEVDPRDALALMESICLTVDYAHQRGVLHRDLKPSNILISQGGASSSSISGSRQTRMPKILDFGLAKAIDAESLHHGKVTLSEQGQLIGTLGYMAPEQARGQLDQLSVRSDVYSLGAVAYELLTGQLPCPLDGPLAQVLGRIESRDPVRPSTIRKQLNADIDAVLLKALEKDPGRRYATAGEMATDIGRYLSFEPIQARRTGPGVRFARWVRRNRAVAAISALSLVLVVSISLSSFLRVVNERDKALHLAAMLENVVTGVDPDHTQSGEFTAVDFLDQFSSKLEGGLGGEWETEARLRERLGIIYIEIGQYGKARGQLENALALRSAHLKATDANIATSKFWLAAAWWNLEDYPRAESLYRESLAIRLSVFGEKSQEVALSRQHLGTCLDSEKKYSEAESLLRQAIATQSQLGRNHKTPTSTRGLLGKCLTHQGKYKEAQLELEEALRATGENYKPKEKSWRYARNLRYLAEHWRDRKEWDQALDLARKALAIQIEVLPPGNRDAATTQKLISELEGELGKAGSNRM